MAALEQHTSSLAVNFDVGAVDSRDLPLGNYPHYGTGIPLAAAGEVLSVLCAAPTLARSCRPRSTPATTPPATSMPATSMRWLRRSVTGSHTIDPLAMRHAASPTRIRSCWVGSHSRARRIVEPGGDES